MGHGDPRRNICMLNNPDGTDCHGPVPSDSPIAACVKHLLQAHKYVSDYQPEHPLATQVWELQQKPIATTVYYIRFGDRIKIGTTSDLRRRLVDLTYDELLAAEPGGYDLERERHEQFRKHRIYRNREWFRDCPELRKHIDAVRRKHGDPTPPPRQGRSQLARDVYEHFKSRGLL